jgi:hypothetical protein
MGMGIDEGIEMDIDELVGLLLGRLLQMGGSFLLEGLRPLGFFFCFGWA